MDNFFRTDQLQRAHLFLLLSSACALSGAGSASPSSTNAVISTHKTDAFEKLKHPVAWLKWGAEFRFRNEYYDNAGTVNSQAKEHEYNYQRYRGRVSSEITPAKNLSLDLRMTTEARYYQKPDSRAGGQVDEFILDHLAARLTFEGDLPVTLALGRQDIMLGNRWLFYDGTTADGSRTDFFNAARVTVNWQEKNTTFDVIYLDQSPNESRWIPAINAKDKPLGEEKVRAAVLYVSNQSFEQTQLDGYVLYKHDQRGLPRGNDGHLAAFGARGEKDWGQHWRTRLEFAPELGHKNGVGLQAFGLNSLVNYYVRDSWDNNFRLSYEYLSGDDPNTNTQEGYDPLWGRRALFSELLGYTFQAENRGRFAEWSNLQRAGTGWSFRPIKQLEWLADYHAVFANENTYRGRVGYSDTGHFRGHLVCGVLKYKFGPHLNGHFWSEFFFPGNYYQAPMGSMAAFFRAQLILEL